MKVAAVVAGSPVAVSEVDAREVLLRASPQAAALPCPGTREGRQLRRWLTQVLVVERVLAIEAVNLAVTVSGSTPTDECLMPDITARLELGSIAACALADPLSRAVFDRITADIDIDEATVADYHRRNPRRFAETSAPTPQLADVAPSIRTMLRGAARRRAFRIWLGQRSAESVWLAPGYEHPGDPRQSDNTHRH